MRSPLLPQMLSSMPTRTCSPSVIAMLHNGSTVRIHDSMNMTDPCGERRTYSIISNGFRLAAPPPIATN